MRIIKVSATQSTNSLAREWLQENKCVVPVCFSTRDQTLGRGQRGASWHSNPGENLTFSIIYPKPQVEIQDQFLISAAVGLAILEVLKDVKINKLRLKWPNDILSANQKLGGILIENIIANGRIGYSIIGIGLNVNQQEFPGLPRATSLRLVTGKEFEIEDLLNKIADEINRVLSSKDDLSPKSVFSQYEAVLYKKDMVSTFKLSDESLLTGIIKGITPTGLLKVQVEDEMIRYFDLKELKLLY